MNPTNGPTSDPPRKPEPEPEPSKEPAADSSRSEETGESGVPESGSKQSGSKEPGSKPEKKQPPWQVPQPELHPELLKEPPTLVDPFAREREKEAAQAAHRKKRSQRRTVVVGLGVTALLAGTITAIVASNEAEPDYAQVCFDDQTGQRVDDTNCGSSEGRGSGLYAWYFYSRGATVPPVGQNRSSYPSYTTSVPPGAKTSTGYSTQGGTVSRGGFGGSAKSGTSGGTGGGKISGG